MVESLNFSNIDSYVNLPNFNVYITKTYLNLCKTSQRDFFHITSTLLGMLTCFLAQMESMQLENSVFFFKHRLIFIDLLFKTAFEFSIIQNSFFNLYFNSESNCFWICWNPLEGEKILKVIYAKIFDQFC